MMPVRAGCVQRGQVKGCRKTPEAWIVDTNVNFRGLHMQTTVTWFVSNPLYGPPSIWVSVQTVKRVL